jgi:hypothetical protein
MQAKLLAIISLALWAWVLPVAHAMPLDADGPSGLSDDADFDDLIVSITSATAAVTPVLVKIAAPWSMAVDAVVLAAPGSVRYVVSSSVESRAPPLARSSNERSS